ncbi:MAG: PRC-barrel domain-containing protein [Sciscionella sp.]
MSTENDPQDLIGNEVMDTLGETIGTVDSVYPAEQSSEPEWVTVKTGLFHRNESVVPLQGAEQHEDLVHVAVERDAVKDAPTVDAEHGLSPTETTELEQHYELGTDEQADAAVATETATD